MIAKKAKNGEMNKIIVMTMLPLRMKLVTLLRVKAQVETFSVETRENNPK